MFSLVCLIFSVVGPLSHRTLFWSRAVFFFFSGAWIVLELEYWVILFERKRSNKGRWYHLGPMASLSGDTWEQPLPPARFFCSLHQSLHNCHACPFFFTVSSIFYKCWPTRWVLHGSWAGLEFWSFNKLSSLSVVIIIL